MSRTRMDGQARQPTGCSETQSGEAGTSGRDVGEELLKGRRQVLNLTVHLISNSSSSLIQTLTHLLYSMN